MKLKNKKIFDNSKSYQQKADIARYEILYNHGGIYLDADMIWLKSNLEDFLPLETSDFIGVQEPFSCISYKYITTPFLANGFMASTKKNSIMKNCINSIPKRIGISTKAFITTGPGLLNSCIDIPVTIIPVNWIFPVDFRGFKTTKNIDKFVGKSLVFTKSGFELINENGGKIPSIIYDYIVRLLYV